MLTSSSQETQAVNCLNLLEDSTGGNFRPLRRPHKYQVPNIMHKIAGGAKKLSVPVMLTRDNQLIITDSMQMLIHNQSIVSLVELNLSEIRHLVNRNLLNSQITWLENLLALVVAKELTLELDVVMLSKARQSAKAIATLLKQFSATKNVLVTAAKGNVLYFINQLDPNIKTANFKA